MFLISSYKWTSLNLRYPQAIVFSHFPVSKIISIKFYTLVKTPVFHEPVAIHLYIFMIYKFTSLFTFVSQFISHHCYELIYNPQTLYSSPLIL